MYRGGDKFPLQRPGSSREVGNEDRRGVPAVLLNMNSHLMLFMPIVIPSFDLATCTFVGNCTSNM